MNNKSRNLNDIYELIDLYRSGEVVGERVEIVVTPKEGNLNEREIIIGLQGGLSRDRDLFIVVDGKKFDEVILPEILKYYSQSDKFNDDWSPIRTTLPNQTSKAVLETESGNLFYIETFDNNLFDRLRKKEIATIKKEPDESEQIEEEPESSLAEEQKDWQKIIKYAKDRRVSQDFYERQNLTSEEIEKIRILTTELSKIQKFAPIKERERKKIEANLETLLNATEWSENLVKIGIDREFYDKFKTEINKELCAKISGTVLIERIATNIQIERKINNHISKRLKFDSNFSKEIFDSKIKFATKELDKKNYFNLRNASRKVFEEHKEDQEYGNTCPGAVVALKRRYENGEEPQIENEEQKRECIAYCDELLEYLEKSAYKNIRVKAPTLSGVEPKKSENVDIEFLPYLPNELNGAIVYKDEVELLQLLDRLELCKQAKVGNEKYELVIERNPDDKKKRLVRLSLTDGVSRHDNFNFNFDNGELFDSKISEIIEKVSAKDAIVDIVETVIDVPEMDRKNILLKTTEGNEVLIKLGNDFEIKRQEQNTPVVPELIKSEPKPPVIPPRKTETLELSKEDRELAEYFRKEILRNKKQLSPVGLQVIDDLATVNEKVAALEEAHKRLDNGKLSKEEFDRIHETYREQLSKTIKEAIRNKNLFQSSEKTSAEDVKSEITTATSRNQESVKFPALEEMSKEVKKLELSKEERELAEYFRKEILRDKKQLPPVGLKDIEDLARSNESVEALEEAHRRLDSGRISKEEFEIIHDAYRAQLAAAIKEASKKIAKGNESKEIDALKVERTESAEILSLLESQLKQAIKDKEEKTVSDKLELLDREIKRVTEKNQDVKEENKTKDNSDFDHLHDLVIKYKVQNIGGILKFFDRNTGKEYFPSAKEKSQIEFANYWNATAGIKANPTDITLGEKCAFNDESRVLYNVMDIHFRESLKREIPIDMEALKRQFENTGYERSDFVYERLFGVPNRVDYIVSYYKTQGISSSKTQQEEILHDNQPQNIPMEEEIEEQEETVEIKEELVIDDNLNIKEEVVKEDEIAVEEIQDEIVSEDEITPVDEIRDAYEVAAGYSSLDRPASLKIFFLKDDPTQVEIIVSNGHGSEEEVLYQREFSKDELMESFLSELCKVYIKENGMTYNQTFDVPNTNKAGSITLGENDNVLQMSNAPKGCVEELQRNLEKAFKESKSIESTMKK